ncbi:hypothetical protein FEDK69T_23430 [Flavobacterium enshiense DK69]|uniref:Ig-like domain-containing protein n=1 Tax=Flavobacterium enshiense DK69 TaxID=1107311 RepID=V6S6N3_9FLAO|nr:T9SS type B sorting domain-containing protein [Flavobacterium enshiense]ESU22358.1 hypothetical protein FEDK69T_23430 [Flavobacterium enshiense DK69]KGO97361.1 hypothetical protein Q767_01825 [Flavobacterium enshiense DK69]
MRVFLAYFFVLTSFLSFSQKNFKTLGFIENKGQIVDQKGKANKAVHYLLNTSGLNVQLRNNGFSYDIYETKKIPLSKKDKSFNATSLKEGKETPDYSLEYNYHRIDIDFLNSNATVKLVAEEKSSDYDNYYNVAHAPEGITNVHKYQKVTYQNIYNNIDAVFFIPKDTTKVVEYNFIVKPGGKVSDIQLKFSGAKTELADNKIRMNVRFGQMEETLPLSWVEQGNSRKEIAIGYKKIKKNVYGFEGDVNASDKTVVIDPVPVRLWGTYYGGMGHEDSTTSIDIDNNGNIYVSGNTLSQDNIGTSGVFQSSNFANAPFCGFAVKINPNGNRIWGTFIIPNSNGNSGVNGMKLNSLNEVLLVGYIYITSSNHLSTPGSHKETGTLNTYDSYILKLNNNGQRIWGTYFGGERDDKIKTISIDSQDNIFIGGETNSTTGISSPNTFQTTNNNNQIGFFSKFSSSGSQIYSSYFPREVNESAIDLNNNVIFSGQYQIGNNYPDVSTPGAHQTQTIYEDAYIAKFDSAGNRLWCTYYGGTAPNTSVSGYSDLITGIDVDSSNNIYVTGYTGSTNGITTPGAYKETHADPIGALDVDVFLVKFNPQGVRQWGTFYGDNYSIPEKSYDISVSDNGDSYITGETTSFSNIATPDGFQPTKNAYRDGFLTKFDTNGHLVWGSYYGGSFIDWCNNVAVKNNVVYVAGITNSSDNIATSGTHKVNVEGNDAFIAKFTDCASSTTTIGNLSSCMGSNINLTVPLGTSYSWTGPNGFASTQQNPVIPNANATHNGLYTCTITGTACDSTASINVLVGDTTAPIPNVATLTTINGDCNTVITTIPTATDNCAGNITAITTSPLNYSTPGTYTIVWNYNDGNGNNNSQNQTVVISATALPTASTSQLFCIQQNATINDITITGQNIKWYDAATGGNLLASSTLLQNGVTYYASQTINGCESARVPVTVSIQNTPAPTGNATQSFCSSQNATLNDIAVSGSNLTWYDSALGTTILPSTTLLANNTTYYATQTVNGCESPTRLAVTVTLINTLNANNYAETLCDDLNNGTETVNLSDYNSDLIATTSGNTFTYYHSQNGAENQIIAETITDFANYNLSIGNNLIFVRIDSNNGCHQVVELNFTLVSKPVIPITDIMPICEGSSITVNAGIGYDSYLWSTSEISSSITITTPGSYSVTVTENHGTVTCTSVKNFTVVNSNAATISEIITSDWTYNQNTITVLLSGNSMGDYVYSLDGTHYQSSNTFTGLESGEYIVYVKDKNGCGIKSEDFYLLMYPKFFTPNGDGYNDYWKIVLSEKEPKMKIMIFDRFGKLIKELGADSQGWDGTFSGNPVPSSDYWFVVKRQNGKEYRGHFSLKR